MINDPSVLKRGDHIAWHRPLAFWHHAVVTRQYSDHVTVVGYSVNNNDDNPCAKVMEMHFKHCSMASVLRGSVYRVTHHDSYTNEYTALRAEKTVGQEKYDFFEQNCEHTATWCKTGLHSSDQLHTCFTSFGKVALAVFLRAIVLAVLLLVQVCKLTHDNNTATAGQLTVERSVDMAYFTLITTVFTTYSIYKDITKLKPHMELSGRELHYNSMESCRRYCTNQAFRYCCHKRPGCSRLVWCICFAACFICSLCQASCSLFASKLRAMCSVPCCGRPAAPVTRLIVRSVVRELIAASGPFIVVWFTNDIVSYFAIQHVVVSSSSFVNRAVIIVIAVIVASLVAYPVGLLVSRWAEGLCEACCCPCIHRSKRAQCKRRESASQSYPVHDQVVSIAAPSVDYHVTSIPVG